jgi:hypothetical protein
LHTLFGATNAENSLNASVYVTVLKTALNASGICYHLENSLKCVGIIIMLPSSQQWWEGFTDITEPNVGFPETILEGKLQEM